MKTREIAGCVTGLLLTWPTATLGQAALVLRDSITLKQTAELFLGLPTSVEVDRDGYLVVDAQQPRVFRFDGSGALVRVFGREGEGPGEFREVAAALPHGDQDVIIFSWAPPRAQVFHRASGEYVSGFVLEPPVEDVVRNGEELWISGLQHSRGTLLRRFSGPEEEVAVGPIPRNFVPGGPLGGIFPGLPFHVWADTVVMGFEPMNDLLLMRRDGEVLDTLEVPRARRRGVPEDPMEAILAAMRAGPYSRVFGVLSRTMGVHRKANGELLVVHFDSRPEGPPVTSSVFVSVISPDRSMACVDATVPVGPDAQPAIGFSEDRLLVLVQVLKGMEAVPVLRSFEVETTGCGWIPIGG
jgi:hypothetical protein